MNSQRSTFSYRSWHSTNSYRDSKINQFLGNPVDSRDENSSEPLRITPTSLSAPKKVDQSVIAAEWRKRLMKMCPKKVPPQRIIVPNLMNNQESRGADPLNRLSVEQIANLRSRSVDDPQRTSSHLPKLRTISRNILSNPAGMRTPIY